MLFMARIFSTLILVLFVANIASGETSKRSIISNHQAWSAILDTARESDECWSMSQPIDKKAYKGSRLVSVRRGEIGLFIWFSKNEASEGQVTYNGGYPFNGDGVLVDVDGEKFKLSLVQDDWAWSSPEDDKKIISAMKSGAKAIVTAVSQRNTKVVDTYSLKGFTAATEAAKTACEK
jgi:invasion protein IalB